MKSSDIPTSLPEFKNTIDLTHWPAGEKAARKALNRFLQCKVFDYQEKRDFPMLDNTREKTQQIFRTAKILSAEKN